MYLFQYKPTSFCPAPASLVDRMKCRRPTAGYTAQRFLKRALGSLARARRVARASVLRRPRSRRPSTMQVNPSDLLRAVFFVFIAMFGLALFGCNERTPVRQASESLGDKGNETQATDLISCPENIDGLLAQLSKFVDDLDYKSAKEMLGRCDRDSLNRNFSDSVKSGKATPFLLGVAGLDIIVPGVDVQFGHLKLRNGQVKEMPGCSDAMIGGAEQARYQSLCLSFAAEFNRNVLKVTDLR